MILDWWVDLRDLPEALLRCMILGTKWSPQELRDSPVAKESSRVSYLTTGFLALRLMNPDPIVRHCACWAQPFKRICGLRGHAGLFREKS